MDLSGVCHTERLDQHTFHLPQDCLSFKNKPERTLHPKEVSSVMMLQFAAKTSKQKQTELQLRQQKLDK